MTPPSPQNPGLTNWLYVTALGIIWGAAFMLTGLSLEGFGPWTVAAGRTLIGGLALWTVGSALGQGLGSLPSPRAIAFASIIGLIATALPFALLSWGLQFVPTAFAGVSMATIPLLILPLVAIFSKEEGIGPRRIIGFTLGFIGLLILIGPDALSQDSGPMAFWGGLACFGAAGSYACGSIITRRAPKMPPLAFATMSLFVASVALVPVALYLEGLPESYPAGPTAALLATAFLPTALAAVIRVRVITTAGSLFMSLTSYQVPVWSVIFGMTLMGEALPPHLFGALALILTGIAISQSRALAQALRR
ncbi:MAG: DMT family transporter [Pseudomonadota bacterium]